MIYLDNAATTFPKPSSVTAEVQRCIQQYCGNPGRGSHRLAMAAAEKIYACREAAASFFGTSGAEQVVFTLNTTYALNFAIKSVLRPGDHVLIGNMEHNAVFRPIHKLAEEGVIRYDVFDTREGADQIAAVLAAGVRKNTRAVICAHMPNLANHAVPVGEIGKFCRSRNLCLILDGAQSAGILPIHMQQMGVDILCVPGHKGLYGPQGCGMLIFCGDRFSHGSTLIEGGSGVQSRLAAMPQELPEHFEAGTLPTPAIAGLLEGIRFVQRTGVETIHRRECALWQQLRDDLSEMPGVHLYGTVPGPILCLNAEGISGEKMAEELNGAGICVRAGYHCAPMGHRVLGTEESGAVRISLGAMNTEREIRRCTDAVARILRNRI